MLRLGFLNVQGIGRFILMQALQARDGVQVVEVNDAGITAQEYAEYLRRETRFSGEAVVREPEAGAPAGCQLLHVVCTAQGDHRQEHNILWHRIDLDVQDLGAGAVQVVPWSRERSRRVHVLIDDWSTSRAVAARQTRHNAVLGVIMLATSPYVEEPSAFDNPIVFGVNECSSFEREQQGAKKTRLFFCSPGTCTTNAVRLLAHLVKSAFPSHIMHGGALMIHPSPPSARSGRLLVHGHNIETVRHSIGELRLPKNVLAATIGSMSLSAREIEVPVLNGDVSVVQLTLCITGNGGADPKLGLSRDQVTEKLKAHAASCAATPCPLRVEEEAPLVSSDLSIASEVTSVVVDAYKAPRPPSPPPANEDKQATPEQQEWSREQDEWARQWPLVNVTAFCSHWAYATCILKLAVRMREAQRESMERVHAMEPRAQTAIVSRAPTVFGSSSVGAGSRADAQQS